MKKEKLTAEDLLKRIDALSSMLERTPTREEIYKDMNDEADEKSIDKLLDQTGDYDSIYYLSKKPIIDKDKCFKNIRYLIKEKNVKVGVIEKEAGLRLGYMARLEKPGNITQPSIEFLTVCSRMLDVKIDDLINRDMTNFNESEKFVISFINKLEDDTVSDKLEWKRLSYKLLTTLKTDSKGKTAYPFFYNPEECTVRESKEFARYHTNFNYGSECTISDECYVAEMPSYINEDVNNFNTISTDIYIMKVKAIGSVSSHVEIYMVENNVDHYPEDSADTVEEFSSIMNIFTTYSSSDESKKIIDELIKKIIKSTERVHIDENTKHLMSNYINGGYQWKK